MADKNTKKNWNTSQSPLAQALEGWSHISQVVKEEKVVPPDQKMLNDITNLLVQLKSQLDELSFGKDLGNLDSSLLTSHSAKEITETKEDLLRIPTSELPTL